MGDEVNYLDQLKSMGRTDGLKLWMIMNREGVIIQSSGTEGEEGIKIAALMSRLADKIDDFATMLGTENQTEEIQTIRLRTMKDEIIMCPSKEYLLVGIQEPGYVVQENKDDDESDGFFD